MKKILHFFWLITITNANTGMLHKAISFHKLSISNQCFTPGYIQQRQLLAPISLLKNKGRHPETADTLKRNSLPASVCSLPCKGATQCVRNREHLNTAMNKLILKNRDIPSHIMRTQIFNLIVYRAGCAKNKKSAEREAETLLSLYDLHSEIEKFHHEFEQSFERLMQ